MKLHCCGFVVVWNMVAVSAVGPPTQHMQVDYGCELNVGAAGQLRIGKR